MLPTLRVIPASFPKRSLRLHYRAGVIRIDAGNPQEGGYKTLRPTNFPNDAFTRVVINIVENIIRSIPPCPKTGRLFEWAPHRAPQQRDMNPAEQGERSEEHTSELQSLMRISYAVFCLKKKTTRHQVYT